MQVNISIPYFYTMHSTVRSGETVALKMTYGNQWIGCAGTWCGKAGCPERFFSKPNSVCWGEVFKIYSKSANGNIIRVGDKVALYYPRAKKWFGCIAYHCSGGYGCPGTPTYTYGFANAAKWTQCWGEVYTIYAYGKSVGQYIVHKDPIMLQYQNKWVSLWEGLTTKFTCPGAAPPGIRKYDFCAGEAFEIFVI